MKSAERRTGSAASFIITQDGIEDLPLHNPDDVYAEIEQEKQKSIITEADIATPKVPYSTSGIYAEHPLSTPSIQLNPVSPFDSLPPPPPPP